MVDIELGKCRYPVRRPSQYDVLLVMNARKVFEVVNHTEIADLTGYALLKTTIVKKLLNNESCTHFTK